MGLARRGRGGAAVAVALLLMLGGVAAFFWFSASPSPGEPSRNSSFAFYGLVTAGVGLLAGLAMASLAGNPKMPCPVCDTPMRMEKKGFPARQYWYCPECKRYQAVY